jgi:general secretion pathway protein J
MRNRRIISARHAPRPSLPRRRKGLTLIELLVAISVLAFVAVLGWRGLDSIVRARIALTEDLEQTRGMQLAFAQLQNDCAHVAAMSSIAGRVPLVIEQDRLTLIRTVFSDNQPSRLQVITYRVREGVLMRRESEATRDLKELDSLWLAAQGETDASQAVALQSGVSAMTMRLWNGAGWHAADAINAAPPVASASSGSRRSSSSSARLMTGLEVALQLQGREASMLKIFLLGPV